MAKWGSGNRLARRCREGKARALEETAPVKHLAGQHEYIEASETAGIGPRIGGSGFGFDFAATVAGAGWSAMRL